MRKIFESIITVTVAVLGLILSIIWYRAEYEIEPLIGIITCAGVLVTNIVYRFFPEEAPTYKNTLINSEVVAQTAVIGDNNTVKIQQILGNLKEYQDLEKALAKEQKLLNSIALENQEARLQVSESTNEKQETLDNIKKAIEQAFEYISKLTISTDRLDQAKALFLEGDIPGALEILKDEAIQADYLALQTTKQSEEERHSRRMGEIAEKTKGIAEEWKMKAVLMATRYEDEDWFEKTKAYYDKALEVYRDVEHIFDYGIFLLNHNQDTEATPLFEEALQIYRISAKSNPEASLPDVARALNNLAILHCTKNEPEKAQRKYEEALKIYKSLAKRAPEVFLPDLAMIRNNLGLLNRVKNKFVQAQREFDEALKIYYYLVVNNSEVFLPNMAGTLNNLAILHSDRNELKQAQIEYEEALKIYRILAKSNPETFQERVAMILNNLGLLHRDKNELEQAQAEYEEALKIRRTLAKSNPKAYLQTVATTLNNLGILHWDKNELEQAQQKYEEALKIFKSTAQSNSETYLQTVAAILNNLGILHSNKNELEQAQGKYEEALGIYLILAQINPQTFLPLIAMTSINMATFYQENIPDRVRSLDMIRIFFKAVLPFREVLPIVQNYMKGAINVVQKWGLDADEFLKEIDSEEDE